MNEEESTKLALEHSRELFIYHAGQRIQSLNFYFVAITVFLTGFGALAISEVDPADRALFGIVLASAGFYLTRLFQRLDKRNEQLVLWDESLLQKAEERLATLDPLLPEWKVSETAKRVIHRVRHYKEIVPSVFGLYRTLSIIAGLYSVWPWTKTVLGL